MSGAERQKGVSPDLHQGPEGGVCTPRWSAYRIPPPKTTSRFFLGVGGFHGTLPPGAHDPPQGGYRE
jgi:hypothetical protein